ncbi:hypothetical protein ACERIT_09190 [Halopenitus sp. H-Gu1]|uniref:hypothetical protein n=1 Tax=Halopenitus sp. H-Gu1 TaxID=3242697 RepID=UPI00359E7FAA
MDESDPSERIRWLTREIESELGSREDVTGFKIRSTEDPGVHVHVETADGTKLYHVTLEHPLDDAKETHWSYLGEVREE